MMLKGCVFWGLTIVFHLTAGIIADKVPGSSILSEDQTSQSGISYSSVPTQQLQSQVSCAQTQNDQTQQQQLSMVSVAFIKLILSKSISVFYSLTLVMFLSVVKKVKPQMQGSPSEVIPVAPNSQSVPAVSPQVCYSTFCIPKSVTASVVQINFDDGHFYKQT